MNNIWMLPKTLIGMTGSLVGRFEALRKAGARWLPWRAEIEALERRLAVRASQHDAALAELRAKIGETAKARGWERDFGELESRVLGVGADERAEIAGLEQRMNEAFATFARQEDMDTRFAAHNGRIRAGEQKADAFPAMVAAVEKALGARLGELEKRFAAHDGRIRAVEQKIDAIPALVAAMEKALGPRVSELEKRFDAQGRSLDELGSSMKRRLDSVEALSAEKKLAPVGQLVDEDTELLKLLHIQL